MPKVQVEELRTHAGRIMNERRSSCTDRVKTLATIFHNEERGRVVCGCPIPFQVFTAYTDKYKYFLFYHFTTIYRQFTILSISLQYCLSLYNVVYRFTILSITLQCCISVYNIVYQFTIPVLYISVYNIVYRSTWFYARLPRGCLGIYNIVN